MRPTHAIRRIPAHSRRSLRNGRRGSVLVEFAMVLPVLVLLLFGMIEFDRYTMGIHAVEEAARVGCRRAILSDATFDQVDADVGGILNTFGIKKYVLTVTPDLDSASEYGDPVTVQIDVAYEDISWLPSPAYLGKAKLSVSSTSLKEQ